MRFAADSHPEGYLIRSYGESALTIRDATYRHAILISATQLLPLPELRRAASLHHLGEGQRLYHVSAPAQQVSAAACPQLSALPPQVVGSSPGAHLSTPPGVEV